MSTAAQLFQAWLGSKAYMPPAGKTTEPQADVFAEWEHDFDAGWEIAKYNHSHDKLGRFASAVSVMSGFRGGYEGRYEPSGGYTQRLATMSELPEKQQDAVRKTWDEHIARSPEEAEAECVRLLEAARTTGAYAEGKAWYGDRNVECRQIAQSTGVKPSAVAAGFAAFSPQRQWTEEKPVVEFCAKAIAQNRTLGELGLTRKDFAVISAKLGASKEADPSFSGGKVHPVSMFKSSKKLGDLDPATAMFVLHTLYRKGGNKGWGASAGWDGSIKMVRALRGEDPDTVLHGVKVRSFYNNISHPQSRNGDVTIDFQMFEVLHGSPRFNTPTGKQSTSLTSTPSLTQNKAKTQIGVQPMACDLVRNLRNYTDASGAKPYKALKPHQIQAIIWTQWKHEKGQGLHR